MKKNLLFLIFLLVGCGSVVSSNESITSNGNSSSSLDTSLTSLKESITSSSSNIVSDTSANEEKIRNVNLINNYTAVHLEENEEARNNIFSRFNDILDSATYKKVDLDNSALKILKGGKWTLNFKYSISKISLKARTYTKIYKDYQTGEDVINADRAKLYVNNIDANLENVDGQESIYKDYLITFENVVSSIEITSLEGRTYLESMKIYYII
ncbi:unknown [Firmicutes bacterium CAG:449]|nr:unknown [Firmicutes bacterium CAG:449]